MLAEMFSITSLMHVHRSHSLHIKPTKFRCNRFSTSSSESLGHLRRARRPTLRPVAA